MRIRFHYDYHEYLLQSHTTVYSISYLLAGYSIKGQHPLVKSHFNIKLQLNPFFMKNLLYHSKAIFLKGDYLKEVVHILHPQLYLTFPLVQA